VFSKKVAMETPSDATSVRPVRLPRNASKATVISFHGFSGMVAEALHGYVAHRSKRGEPLDLQTEDPTNQPELRGFKTRLQLGVVFPKQWMQVMKANL